MSRDHLGRSDAEVERIQKIRDASRAAWVLSMRELVWFCIIESHIVKIKGTLKEAINDIDRLVISAIEDGDFEFYMTNVDQISRFFFIFPHEKGAFSYDDIYRPVNAQSFAESIKNAEKAARDVFAIELEFMGEETCANANNLKKNLALIKLAGADYYQHCKEVAAKIDAMFKESDVPQITAAEIAEVRAKLYAPRHKIDFGPFGDEDE